MLKLSDLKIDASSLGARLWLVSIEPYYTYKDGSRTDEVEGHKYVVTLPDLNFEKLAVKIPGKQLCEAPDGYAQCKFQGLELTAYQYDKTIAISAKATNIELVKH